MVCPNCQSETTSVTIRTEGTFCHECLGVAETSGARVDNTMARNSFRVREQQQNHEGDTLPPHRYNRETRQAEPNPDFIDRFPDMAHHHYSSDELKKAGHDKLAKKVKADKKTSEIGKADKGAQFKGSTKKGMKRVLNAQ